MKVILRTADSEQQSEHDIPPSEVEAFVALCRNHVVCDGVHDPALVEVTTQMCIDSGAFEVIVFSDAE